MERMRQGGGATPRRARLVAPALVLLLALAALPAPPTAAAPPTPTHDPVYIASNADFNAANGVISGVGTPADPYVIAGWRFYAASGTAIIIRNVTAAFVIRDNIIEAPNGVSFSESATTYAHVRNNQFIVRGTGLAVMNADAYVANNSFIQGATLTTGIVLTGSASIVANNSFVNIRTSIVATYGSPVIVGNNIQSGYLGISVRSTSDAQVRLNEVSDVVTQIHADSTLRTRVEGNVVVNGDVGMSLWINKEIEVHNNTVRAMIRIGVQFETSTGNLTANVIVDGQGDGVQIWHSPLLIANNTISNNLGIALHFMMASATVNANVMVANGMGIYIADETVVRLTANVMINNTVGVSIPYVARQSIPWMSANLVNGVNIDGSLVASQRVYFYHAANVQVVGQVRDSGFSAGYYGSLTAEGQVVLYEVDNANVEVSVLSHSNVGVTAVNSFNVVVEGSLINDIQAGVQALAVSVPFQVPACAVSVKNTTINITIDPVLTVGIDARGCLVNALNNSISIVSTGIRLDANAWGNVSGNVVTRTDLGLDVAGRAGYVSVRGNTVVSNRVGARFSGTQALVAENRFEANVVAGVVLTQRADLRFERNNVSLNGMGVMDSGPCAPQSPYGVTGCGALRASGNEYYRNDGDGVRVNGTSSFDGDVFLRNGGAGARLASATLVDVNATANRGSGATLTGLFDVSGSLFDRNGDHGLVVVGSGDVRSSTMTRNLHAGLRATATYVTASDLNVSYNEDGILFDELVPALPTVQVGPGSLGGGAPNPDPLDVHRSVIWRNTRDGIRAGAAVVNATHNWWGGGAPAISVADQVGAFQNGVSPTVRFLPYFTDRTMTNTGPVPGL